MKFVYTFLILFCITNALAMTMKIRPFAQIAALLLCFSVVSCAPTMATRGNYVEPEQLKSLQTGVSTREEVAQTLGTPTTTDPFDPNTWFYIGEKTATKAFFMPKVKSRHVVVMQFNQDGLLQSAREVDEKSGKQVEVVKKQTPAAGREVNAFQQFLGNLGKFNSNSSGASQAPGGK